MLNLKFGQSVRFAYGMSLVALIALASCEPSISKPDKTNVPQPATTKPAVEAEVDSTVSLTLKWKDFGADMTYEVYRGTSADFEPNYSTLVSSTPFKTSFGDDRLNPATTYYYKVYCRKTNSTDPATHIGDVSATTPSQDAPLKR